jgi:hypothetical protein
MVDDETETDVMKYTENKGTSVICYDCPYCRSRNNKNIEVFSKEEIIQLIYKDNVEYYKLNNKVAEYRNQINRLQEESINIDFFLDKDHTDAKIIKTLVRELEDLKKTNMELVEIQYDNINKNNEIFDKNVYIRKLKTEMILLKQQRNKEIIEYNDMVFKINEMKAILNGFSNQHNLLYNETKVLIDKKKWKDLFRLYKNDITVEIQFKKVIPKQEYINKNEISIDLNNMIKS